MELEHFSKSEFTDYDKMEPFFLEFLDELREKFGKPIILNSTYRNPTHNEAVGGVKTSAHTETPCAAADIKCTSSRDRLHLVAVALELGCTRIGIGETFVHVDFSATQPQEVMWTYY